MKVVSPRAVKPIEGFDLLIDRIVGLDHADIPGPALQAGKDSLLDTLGVAYAARNAAGMRSVFDVTVEDGGAQHAFLWGTDTWAPVGAAAFYNAAISHALDFDSLHPRVGHVDAVVIPVALALAQWVGASGKEFIAASIHGSELSYRLGRATRSSHGWYRPGVLSTFGATAAAGKLLKLNAAQLKSALGLALVQVSGTQQGHVERTLSKRMQAAFSARSAVVAARMAKAGITGPSRSLDGKFGLFALFDAAETEGLADDYGQVFLNTEANFKKYPTCGCTHAALDAALSIGHTYRSEEIAQITIHITPYAHQLVGYPYTPDGQAEVIGQFCIQYIVAIALLRGRFGVDELSEAAVFSTDVQSLIKRTEVKVLEGEAGAHVPASVVVETVSGQKEQKSTHVLPALRSRNEDRDALTNKARLNFRSQASGLSEEATERLVQKIAGVEQIHDMREFFADRI